MKITYNNMLYSEPLAITLVPRCPQRRVCGGKYLNYIYFELNSISLVLTRSTKGMLVEKIISKTMLFSELRSIMIVLPLLPEVRLVAEILSQIIVHGELSHITLPSPLSPEGGMMVGNMHTMVCAGFCYISSSNVTRE